MLKPCRLMNIDMLWELFNQFWTFIDIMNPRLLLVWCRCVWCLFRSTRSVDVQEIDLDYVHDIYLEVGSLGGVNVLAKISLFSSMNLKTKCPSLLQGTSTIRLFSGCWIYQWSNVSFYYKVVIVNWNIYLLNSCLNFNVKYKKITTLAFTHHPKGAPESISFC